jgi:hypothetical protein
MFYYKLSVNGPRGVRDGYGTAIQSKVELPDHEDIVDAAIEQGVIEEDEIDRVSYTEEISEDEYKSFGE